METTINKYPSDCFAMFDFESLEATDNFCLAPWKLVPEIFKTNMPISNTVPIVRLTVGQSFSLGTGSLIKTRLDGLKLAIEITGSHACQTFFSTPQQIIVAGFQVLSVPIIVIVNCKGTRGVGCVKNEDSFLYAKIDGWGEVGSLIPVCPSTLQDIHGGPDNFLCGMVIQDITFSIQRRGDKKVVHRDESPQVQFCCMSLFFCQCFLFLCSPICCMRASGKDYDLIEVTDRVVWKMYSRRCDDIWLKFCVSFNASDPVLSVNGIFPLFDTEGDAADPIVGNPMIR